LKKKGAFVLKNTLNEPIPETLENNVTIGDLAANPLEYLNTILEEVYLPLLTNSKNMDSWPEVVATDVLRHFYKVNGAVYVISGKTKVSFNLIINHIYNLLYHHIYMLKTKHYYKYYLIYREKHFYHYLMETITSQKMIKHYYIPLNQLLLIGHIK